MFILLTGGPWWRLLVFGVIVELVTRMFVRAREHHVWELSRTTRLAVLGCFAMPVVPPAVLLSVVKARLQNLPGVDTIVIGRILPCEPGSLG